MKKQELQITNLLTVLLITFSLIVGGCSSNTEPTSKRSEANRASDAEYVVRDYVATNNAEKKSSPAKQKGRSGKYDDDGVSERYAEINENPFLESSRAPLSTFSIDVDTASYTNMRRYINEGSLPPKDAVRIEELVNYFEYDYPQPIGGVPFSVKTEVAKTPWNSKHKIVQIGLQGKKVSLDNVPPSNLVFLLDVSGSMSEELGLLKNSLRMLVNQGLRGFVWVDIGISG